MLDKQYGTTLHIAQGDGPCMHMAAAIQMNAQLTSVPKKPAKGHCTNIADGANRNITHANDTARRDMGHRRAETAE